MLKILKSSLSTPSLNKIIKQTSQLTKFKLSLLNGVVTVSSYALYSAPYSCLPLFMATLSLSMSTQALNQYIQIQYDKKMVRTSQRPLVQGVNPNIALALGSTLGILGILGLYSYNPTTAAIGAAIWIGYLGIYTRMKRSSQLNTFFGSLIGSMPVYLGWAASGRSMCMVQPFALFVYMMAWQHQHFYGIRWIYFNDYNNAGFKMEKQKTVASSLVLAQTIFSIVFMNYSLQYFDFPHCYLFNLPLTIGIYWWGIRPAIDFSRQKISAKEMKMQSYKHFTLVFCIFLLCSFFSKNRKEINLKERNKTKSHSDDIFNVYF